MHSFLKIIFFSLLAVILPFSCSKKDKSSGTVHHKKNNKISYNSSGKSKSGKEPLAEVITSGEISILFHNINDIPVIRDIQVRDGLLRINNIISGLDLRYMEIPDAANLLKKYYSNSSTLLIDGSTLCANEIQEILKTSHVPEIYLRLSGKDITHLVCLESIKTDRLYLEIVENKDISVFRILKKLKNLYGLIISNSTYSGEVLDAVSSLRGLRYLSMHNQKTGDFKKLAALTSLHTLKLPLCNISGDFLKNIVNPAKIKNLDLSQTKLDTKQYNYLKSFKNIEKLCLRYTKFSGTQSGLLGEMKKLSSLSVAYTSEFNDKAAENIKNLKLRNLDIEGTGVTEFGMDELKNIRTLEKLNISFLALSPEILGYLRKLPRLVSLTMRNSNLTTKSLKRIGKLETLKELDLSGSKIDDSVTVELGKLKNLQVLRLDETTISDTGFKHIVSLHKLKSLSLMKSSVSGTALEKISIKGLKFLSIGGTSLRDDIYNFIKGFLSLETLKTSGLMIEGKLLSSLSTIPNLRELDLSGTAVTDEVLVTAADLPSLEKVYVIDTGVTCKSVLELYKKKPTLKVFGPSCDLKENETEKNKKRQKIRVRKK
ncbi:MAG: hypothetical protein JXR95_04845 [Deltaproteobacteria bacterium]|nr:hypothetical protein [Deltaproteobacteria bacterium]